MPRFCSALSISPSLALAQSPSDKVIRSSTHVVVVNVVAKDKHGQPVDDLKREDFELRDNGQSQKIALFSMDESKVAIQAPFGNAPLTFTNRPVPGGARATAFLFDELNTKLSDQ